MNNKFSKQESIERDGHTVRVSVKTAQDGSYFILREGSYTGRLWPADELEALYRLIGAALGKTDV